MFIIIDGPDGVGKSVFVDAMREALANRGKRVLDLRDYWREHGTHPDGAQLDCDVLLSAEPTGVLAGKLIREELIRTGTSYSASAIAQAYALDRHVLYERTILPALAKGILVIQDRSVSTSLVYQPLDAKRKGESLTVEDVRAIPGNAFALKHAPDLLVIPTAPVDVLMARLEGREKQDHATFEQRAFLTDVVEAFSADWFTQLYAQTRIIYPDANQSLAHSRAEAVRLLDLDA